MDWLLSFVLAGVCSAGLLAVGTWLWWRRIRKNQTAPADTYRIAETEIDSTRDLAADGANPATTDSLRLVKHGNAQSGPPDKTPPRRHVSPVALVENENEPRNPPETVQPPTPPQSVENILPRDHEGNSVESNSPATANSESGMTIEESADATGDADRRSFTETKEKEAPTNRFPDSTGRTTIERPITEVPQKLGEPSRRQIQNDAHVYHDDSQQDLHEDLGSAENDEHIPDSQTNCAKPRPSQEASEVDAVPPLPSELMDPVENHADKGA